MTTPIIFHQAVVTEFCTRVRSEGMAVASDDRRDSYLYSAMLRASGAMPKVIDPSGFVAEYSPNTIEQIADTVWGERAALIANWVENGDPFAPTAPTPAPLP